MIEVEKLEKTFRVARHHRGFFGALRNLVETESDVVRAVDGVSFSIDEGEFVGFIGPNGAGKSTTIKMLTGVLEPSGGARARRRARAAARPDRAHRAASARVRPAHAALVGPAGDRVLHTSAARLPRRRSARTTTSSRGSRSCSSIAPLLDVPVRKLSLGQRMRCELGAALLHAPRLLFLDEPTIGLDVVAKEAIREFLATENRERRTTILLTTHDLSDIERLCPRMILIDHGTRRVRRRGRGGAPRGNRRAPAHRGLRERRARRAARRRAGRGSPPRTPGAALRPRAACRPRS